MGRTTNRTSVARPVSGGLLVALAAMPLGAVPLASAQDAGGSAEPAPEAEVVITARYGEAQVKAETEITEAEIASYGADSVGEVLERLATTGVSGEDEPLILVNGKEVGFDRSILAYPPEALNRIGILRTEAASAYGQPPGRRVVNLVLKSKFTGRDGTAGGQWATRGGQRGESINLGQFAIAGPVRWNVQARASRDGALLARDRDVPARTGPVDLTGYVTGSDGGEIDAALSAAAGRTVRVAGLSDAMAQRPPALADFLATADHRRTDDGRGFETLLPSRRNLSVQFGVARPVGKVNAALSLTASSTRSLGLRGLAMAELTLPAGHPWSPFADDVRLVRPVAPGRVLRQESRGESIGASLSLSAGFGQWQTNVAFGYTRSTSRGLYERGAAIDAMQRLIDLGDAGFSPYAPFDPMLVTGERNRSRNDTLSTQFNVARPLATLPAGQVTVSLSGTVSRNRSDQQRADLPEGGEIRDVRWRDQQSGQVAFALPVARRGKEGGGLLGDLGFDVTLGAQKSSGSPRQTQIGAGANWTPHPALRLRGAVDRQEVVPGFDQLDDAPVETVRRVYDVVRQETADILWITGGNPALRSGSRQSLTLSALVRPLNSQMLTLNLNYSSRSGSGGIAAFPELGPAVEAAFPERVTRDASGRLVAVDARAINIDRASEAEFSSGIVLRLPDPGAPRGGAGGGAGGAPDAVDPLRLTLSARHMVRLYNRIVTREGLAPLDLLRDSGQPRHRVSLQATVGKRSFGADVDAGWSSPAEVRTGGGGPDAVVRFTQPVMVRLGLFVQPVDLLPARRRPDFLKKLRLSVDIDNLLDRARRARLADGSTAPGYRRDEIDPVGRTIRLSVRVGL